MAEKKMKVSASPVLMENIFLLYKLSCFWISFINRQVLNYLQPSYFSCAVNSSSIRGILGQFGFSQSSAETTGACETGLVRLYVVLYDVPEGTTWVSKDGGPRVNTRWNFLIARYNIPTYYGAKKESWNYVKIKVSNLTYCLNYKNIRLV